MYNKVIVSYGYLYVRIELIDEVMANLRKQGYNPTLEVGQ